VLRNREIFLLIDVMCDGSSFLESICSIRQNASCMAFFLLLAVVEIIFMIKYKETNE
jgi:hypothetical protein